MISIRWTSPKRCLLWAALVALVPLVGCAPADLFFAADESFLRRLEQRGLVAAGTPQLYGIGRIVITAARTAPAEVTTLRDLLRPEFKTVAIANPEHAPYGRAAVAAMQNAKIYDLVKNKLVFGENISQAAQFVQSGAAEIGIIALSITMSEPMRRTGVYWTIPRETYPALKQGAVLLKHGGAGAKAFHEWLRRAEARKILEKYGFGS